MCPCYRYFIENGGAKQISLRVSTLSNRACLANVTENADPRTISVTHTTLWNLCRANSTDTVQFPWTTFSISIETSFRGKINSETSTDWSNEVQTMLFWSKRWRGIAEYRRDWIVYLWTFQLQVRFFKCNSYTSEANMSNVLNAIFEFSLIFSENVTCKSIVNEGNDYDNFDDPVWNRSWPVKRLHCPA